MGYRARSGRRTGTSRDRSRRRRRGLLNGTLWLERWRLIVQQRREFIECRTIRFEVDDRLACFGAKNSDGRTGIETGTTQLHLDRLVVLPALRVLVRPPGFVEI